jgi:hypothetical protein
MRTQSPDPLPLRLLLLEPRLAQQHRGVKFDQEGRGGPGAAGALDKVGRHPVM